MKSTYHKTKVGSTSPVATKPRRFRPLLEILEDRLVPATLHWNVDTDGLWEDAANWDLGRAPNFGDDVIIDRGAANPTITVHTNQYIHLTSTEKISITGGDFHPSYTAPSIIDGTLEINGGNLVNDTSLRLNGTVNWYSGITVGTVTFAGTTHLIGSQDKGSYRSLIANEGHMIMEGTGSFVPVDIGYTIENRAGAVFEIQSDADADGMSFINYGTVRKTGGTGESIIGGQYSNFVEKAGSLVEGNSGKLTLYSRYGEGCTINAGAGAVVDLTGGGSFYWAGTYTGSGAGRIELSQGGIYSDTNNPAIFNFPQGLFHWTGGAMGGGQLVNQGYIQISGDTDKYVWNGGINNFGHILQTGLGNVVQVGGGLFRNKPTGVYEINGDGDVGGYFYNEGLFRKIGGMGETKTSTPDQYGNKGAFLHMGGTVEALTGTLALGGGNESAGGVLKPAAGAAIELNGGFDTYFNGTFSIIGEGKVLQANASIGTGPNFIIDATQGHFVWTGGSFYGYGLTTQGDVELAGPDGKALERTTWNIQGTVRHTGGSLYGSRSVVDINPTGIYDMQGDFSLENIVGSGQLNLLNRGLFRKSSGVGQAFLNNDYTDTLNGTFEVQTGTLTIPRSGTFDTATMNVAAGATLLINDRPNGASKNYRGLIQGHGLGHIQFLATILTPGSDTATFNFDPGLATVGNDTYFGASAIFQGEITFNSSTYIEWRGTFVNQGTINLTGTSGLGFYTGGCTFDNQGTFNILNDSNLVANSGYGYQLLFTNEGSIRKIGGTGTSKMYSDGSSGPFLLTNTGTIEVLTGTLSIESPTYSLPQTVSGKLTGGTWKAGPGATLTLPNAGAITNNQANITLTGPGANFTNIAGLNRNEGTLRIDQGKSFTTTGNFTNTGHLEAGTSSTFQANGTLTLTGTSTVHVDITGSVASGAFGKVKSTGAATLAGTLEVNLQGYGPSSSEQYPVMGYASKTGSFAAITGLDPYLSALVNSTAVVLNGQGTPPDLDVISITPPFNGIVGQNTTVNYIVKNLSNTPANGIWKDAIYLSRDRILSPDDKVLGLADHTGIVDANGTYQGSLTAVVPNLIDGNYYIIVVADAKHNVADSDRSNNTEAGTAAITVQISNFSVGLPASGTLSLNQPVYYRLIVPSDRPDLLLSLNAANGTAVELYAAQGRLPSTADFDLASPEFNSNIATTLVSNPGLSTWYVMAVARGGATSNFSLSAVAATPQLTGASPNKIGNTGKVTLALSGNQLRASDLYQIVAPNGTTFTAAQVAAAEPRQVTATFDLNSVPLGQYTVQLVRNGQIIALTDKITVEATHVTKPVPVLVMPGSYRAGLIFQGAVVYRNDGNIDIPAPIIIITGNANTKVTLNRQDLVGVNANTADNDRVVLGVSRSSNPGILRPGEEARIPFWALESTGSGAGISVDYQTADSTDPIDWAAVSIEMRPPGLSDSQWTNLFNSFKAAVGNTWGNYVKLMSDYAAKVKYAPSPVSESEHSLLSFVPSQESLKSFETQRIVQYAMYELSSEAGKAVGGTLRSSLTGAILPGIRVQLTSSDGSVSSSSLTDSNGVYRIGHLPVGVYSVSVLGYLLSTPLTVNYQGAIINDFDVNVAQGGVIEGHVQRASDSALLIGLRIFVTDADGRRWTTQTDALGQYQFTGLPSGTYQLSSSGPGLASITTAPISVASTDVLTNIDLVLPLAAVIHGLVRINGTPAAQVHVALNDVQGNFQSVDTGAQGQFTFTSLTAGDYRLTVVKSGFVSQVMRFTVGNGSETNLPAINLTNGATLKLTVENALHQPIASSDVALLKNGVALQYAPTDSQGKLIFSELASGQYDLVVSAKDQTVYHGTVTLNTGATTTQTVTMQPIATVHGVVLDTLGNPVPNFSVNFLTTGVPDGIQLSSVITDINGQYSKQLYYGDYAITVGNGIGIRRQNITADSNHLDATVNFALSGSTLQGHVVGADGVTPVVNGVIELRQAGQAIASARTDDAGNYFFRYLVSGQYDVQGRSDQGFTNIATVSVMSDQAAAPVLTTGSFTLSGMILDNNQSGFTGAVVTLTPVSSVLFEQFSSVLTSSSGGYQFAGVVAGQYRLRVQGINRVISDQLLTINGNTAQDVTLSVGTEFSGQVLYQGAPLADATVTVLSSLDGTPWGDSSTDAQGHFTISHLPEGTFTVLVQKAGLQSSWTTQTISASSPSSPTLVLVAENTEWTGVVSDENGKPVPMALLQFRNDQGEIIEQAITDLNGSFTTKRIPAGNYSVEVQLFGYHPQKQDNLTLTSGSVLTTNITLATAGTDDETEGVDTFTDVSAYLLSSAVTPLTDLFTDNTLAKTAKPVRLSSDTGLSDLTPLTSKDCSARIDAFFRALAAYDSKESQFEGWKSNYEGLKDALKFGSATFALQMADLVGAIVLAYNARAMQALGSASNAALGGMTALQVGTFFIEVEHFIHAASHAHSFEEVGTALKKFVAASFGAFESYETLKTSGLRLTNTFSEVSHLSHAVGTGLSLAGIIVKTINLADQTNKSYDALINLSQGSKKAQQQYLDAFLKFYDAKQTYEQTDCPDTKDPKPKPPRPGPRANIGVWRSTDPNQLQSTGVGEFGAVRPDETISYTANFENLPTADAPAQIVKITLPLSSNLDWSTLQITGIGFNDVNLALPPGLKNYETTVTSSSDPSHPVKVTISFNPVTGELVAVMQSIDPLTGLATDDPAAGFLPPDDATGRGRGYLTFDIQAKSNLPAGTEIKNQASIVFDANAPLATNQSLNTIDTETPVTKVNALPATTTSTSFTVNWTGQDPHHGAGIVSYNIYVSTNNGPFTLWKDHTTDTSAVFTGDKGKKYRFYSTALDGLGFEEDAPTTYDAVIEVLANLKPSIDRISVANGEAQRSRFFVVQVYFNTIVTFDKGAFELYLNGKRFTISGILTSIQDGKTVATLQFLTSTLVKTSLPEGQYRLVTRAKSIKAQTGGLKMESDQTDTFFRLFGDVNGDGRVDATDLAVFNTTYGKKAGQSGYLWFLDFDGNGKIDAKDQAAIRSRLRR